MRKCKCCEIEKELIEFPVSGCHTGKKNGETKTYYRSVCKGCFNGEWRNLQITKQRDKIHRLVNWPAPALAAVILVTGFFNGNSVTQGTNRICFYESIYGVHALNINAVYDCPITAEFDV
jgi:hypothetical protein